VRDRATELAQHLPLHLRIRTLYGGVSVNPQMLALRGGADLVIATPGRLLDLVGKRALSLSGLQCLVIDEADKLMELGFSEEMREVLSLLPDRRQTLMFSATMNAAVQEVINLFLKVPTTIQVEAGPSLALDIQETAYLLSHEHKGPFLRELLVREPWPQVLVFVASGRRADNVVRKLGNNGLRALSLHGDKSMSARVDALDQFRNGRCPAPPRTTSTAWVAPAAPASAASPSASWAPTRRRTWPSSKKRPDGNWCGRASRAR
jgi:ATP-dependent RNA helicase RhlE